MATTPLQGLSSEQIDELMASSRTRNAYAPRLVEFCDSDEAAVNPADVWPEFKAKKASTLYQGFNNAVKKGQLEDTILVKLWNENVFLLHKERVAIVQANGADDSED
jgi:hypothetical protein